MSAIYESCFLIAEGAVTLDLLLVANKSTLQLVRVDETKALDSDASSTLDRNQPWLDIDNEGIKEAIGFLVVCEVFSIQSYFQNQNVWFGKLGDLNLQFAGAVHF